jgi:anaerobic magnesium-protoporphyrin IX monomethyl ester cyclase
MEVLLVAPLFENPKYPLYLPSENLGLAYLAAMLRSNGIDVEILDANMRELEPACLPDYAVGRDYDVIGVSVPFQSVVDESFRIAKEMRAAWPNSHITFGGHYPTFRHREILAFSADVDSVVRGDGEDVLLSLCEALRAHRGLALVAGLTFRDSVGRVVENLPRPPREDLDSLPWPARDSLRDLIMPLGHPWPTQVCSSRGCYASCAFCDIRSFYGRTWRARGPAPLVDEIEWLHHSFGSRTFRFTDDEFIGPRPGKGMHGPTRARAIASELVRRNLHVELMIDSRPEAVDKDLFLELREAGVIDCLVGVESGVDRILKLYSKGATVAKNIKAVETLRDVGISLNLGFIMFDPRMTIEELRQNFSFLNELSIMTVDSVRSWLWPLFGTPVVDQLRAAGLVESESIGDIIYRFADPLVQGVFNIISECADRSRPFDRKIFQVRRNNPKADEQLAEVMADYLLLWSHTFECALKGDARFDFSWFDKECQRLADSVSAASTALYQA